MVAPTPGCQLVCDTLRNLRWCNRRLDGAEPFDWNTIDAGLRRLEVDLSPTAATMLLDLSGVYVNALTLFRDKNVPDPYEPNNWDEEEVEGL